jgi:transposase InsO family protein
LTVENHASAPAAPNLVQRRFYVVQPNRVWVGDMTFIRTRTGFLYLAVLLDLYARRVVGWSMNDRPDLAVVLGELNMALESRRPARGLIHHTDQGAIYAARGYRGMNWCITATSRAGMRHVRQSSTTSNSSTTEYADIKRSVMSARCSSRKRQVYPD